MLTEKDISQHVTSVIKSPIRIGNLTDLGIDTDQFTAFFKPYFQNLADDVYLVKQKQFNFLTHCFIKEYPELEQAFKPYHQGYHGVEVFSKWIDRLSTNQKIKFELLNTVTRQRSIASFEIIVENNNAYGIKRLYENEFQQKVADKRIWRRTFEQSPPKCVESTLFKQLLKQVTELLQTIHPTLKKLKITSHFMRTIARQEIPGENAPEGIHEDGADYILSALVIQRKNISGGITQIFEKHKSEQKLLFAKALNPGEFSFQADTGEEKTFGNDLWHYVTPIVPVSENIGIRDIIGLDIDILF